MNFVLQPWQLFFLVLASWINRQQLEVVEYLRTENQGLKEKLGKRRFLLNDDQRRRPAVKGKILGRKRLTEMGTLFTPDTILRWLCLLRMSSAFTDKDLRRWPLRGGRRLKWPIS